MILAYHAIFSTYGFWLPNDPRGSWSDYIRRWELYCFGPATKTNVRHSLAARPHDHRRRQEAKRSLTLPEVAFSGRQAMAVGRGFARAADRSGYHLLACSILPQHVHAVVRRANHPIERVVGHLKAEAGRQLAREQLHPFQGREPLPSPWARRAWYVFLDNVEAIRRAIRYVEQNPVKEGKRRQKWTFVMPWDGTEWPPV